MSLQSYVQTHLAASEGGVRLFARAARSQSSPATMTALRRMSTELVRERDWLRSLLESLGGPERTLLTLGAIAGEKVGRLVPHGRLLRRTDTTDLMELEALRTAVSAKLSGFDGLLTVAAEHPEIDVEELTRLRDQAESQRERLQSLHAEAARRALTRDPDELTGKVGTPG